MKGKIFSFDVVSDAGLIASEDADRYEFSLAAWKSIDAPFKGTPVEFSFARDGSIEEIRKVAPVIQEESDEQEDPFDNDDEVEPAASQVVLRRTESGKSRFVAAALAFFLGGLGIHKFYLGDRITGAIMLVIFLFGLLFMAIPTAVVALIALIECMIYLFTSAEDFDRNYIQGKRAWF